MTEQCVFCGNAHLTAKKTRYLHQVGDEMLIVDQVPCIECDFCGEQYFEAQVLKQIEADHQAITEHRKQPSRFVSVAVEEYRAA